MPPKLKCHWCRQDQRAVLLDADGSPHDPASKHPPFGTCHTFADRFWLCREVHPEDYTAGKGTDHGRFPRHVYKVGKTYDRSAVSENVSKPKLGGLHMRNGRKSDSSHNKRLARFFTPAPRRSGA